MLAVREGDFTEEEMLEEMAAVVREDYGNKVQAQGPLKCPTRPKPRPTPRD